MKDYNNTEKLYQAIVTNIYGDRLKSICFDQMQVSLFNTDYPINPTVKYLTHPNASVRNTQYPMDVINDALNHKIETRDAIQEAIDGFLADPNTNLAVFSENCGTSKTGSLVTLFDRRPEQMIATFHTKEARDRFVNRCESDVRVVHSNSEIVNTYLDEDQITKVENARRKFYEKAEKEQRLEQVRVDLSSDASTDSTNTGTKGRFEQFLDSALKDNLITQRQYDNILKDYNHACYLLTTDHKLAMTSLKFMYLATFLGSEHKMRSSPVFMDEILYHGGQVTHITDQQLSVYSADWTIYSQHPAVRPDKLLTLSKMCFITADRVIEHELSAQGIGYTKIGQHSPMITRGLEIVRVASTTSNNDVRNRIYNKLLQHTSPDQIVANNTETANNFVNMRGSNDVRHVDELYVIASYPTADEVARVMASCRCDESEAIRILNSDTVNQMIGRNMGYRDASGSNRCLLIVPASMDVELDYVTDSVTMKSTWTRANNRSDFHFANVINDLYDFVDDQTAIDEYLIGERKRGVDEVMVASVANEFNLETRAVGWMLKNLGYPTKRRKRVGITYRAVLLTEPT